MKVPRLVRFKDMLHRDHTRFPEFACGFVTALIGLWIYLFWYPPSAETAYWLWKFMGPTTQGFVFMTAGIIQMLAAGTKWVLLRYLISTFLMIMWIYVFVIFYRTSFVSLNVPFVLMVCLIEFWVSIRIMNDRAVNGGDRRLYRQYYGEGDDHPKH